MNVQGEIRCSLGASLGSNSVDDYNTLFIEKKELLSESLEWLQSNDEGLGWFDLPLMDTQKIKETAQWLTSYEAIVHVGIGGSALGNLMLHQALTDEYHNELPKEQRGPLFYIADNPDPHKVSAIWERVKNKRIALIGVSKSGETAETMAQFLWFYSKLKEIKGDKIADHILIVTDPQKGIFRSFANTIGCRVLEIPSTVGGRYSVLSAGALVTAAALGIKIEDLLNGAKEMRQRILSEDDVALNLTTRLAFLHLFHEKHMRPMVVFMPYSSRLERLSEWFAQLWGESIGKKGLGTTPVRALGAIDQHSQVQLYTEGPDDKFYIFMYTKNLGEKLYIPEIHDRSLDELSYLSGIEMGEMLGCEATSTASALIKAGRPVSWIEMDEISPYSLGQFIFFYECVTAITGRLLGINPFNQPGVEQGKHYTYGLMGRKDYESYAQEVNKVFSIVKDALETI